MFLLCSRLDRGLLKGTECDLRHAETGLKRLGYAAEPAVLHLRGNAIPETHPYALEIKTLLKPDGAVRAQAVFDVEGVPTVVFVGDDDEPLTPGALDEARQRIWNQNLATVVIEVAGDEALAVPARKLKQAGERLSLSEARPDGPFSALDVASANLTRRSPSWFDVKARVDRKLLANLAAVVSRLAKNGFDEKFEESTRQRLAELLMGQVLFISYLEHREIVGPTYRDRREVGQLHALVGRTDHNGIRTLIDWLRADFNGDFLGDDRHDPWAALTHAGFGLLDEFPPPHRHDHRARATSGTTTSATSPSNCFRVSMSRFSRPSSRPRTALIIRPATWRCSRSTRPSHFRRTRSTRRSTMARAARASCSRPRTGG